MPRAIPISGLSGVGRGVQDTTYGYSHSLIAMVAIVLFIIPMIINAGTLEVNAAAAHSGAYGLEVTLGTCTPDTLTIAPPPSTISGSFTGCTSLVVEAVRIIEPGAEFSAGSRVIFRNGFSVARGASLSTKIKPALTGPWAFVQDDSLAQLAGYRAAFRLDADELSLQSGDRLDHLTGHAVDGTLLFRVSLLSSPVSNEKYLILAARNDDGSYTETALGEYQTLPSGQHELEIKWQANAGAGQLLIGIGHPAVYGFSNLDNGSSRLKSIRWGAVSGNVTGSTGKLLLDDFRSFRD